MTKMVKQSKKGFTLVELVVVIAILAILAAIAIPVISNTINSSKKSGAASDAQTLELALKEADAQIVAGDKSKYTGTLASTTVADVSKEKSLKVPGTVEAGKTYYLVWTKDEKCIYADAKTGTAVTEISSGKKYEVLKDLSGSSSESNTTVKLADLFK